MTLKDQARRDLEIVIDQTVALGHRCGLSIDDIAGLFQASLDKLRHEQTVVPATSSILPQQMNFLSHMIGLWARDPLYVDETGQPLVLPRSGDPVSLGRLYAQALKTTTKQSHLLTEEEAITYLAQHGAIDELSPGQWQRTSMTVYANRKDRVSPFAQLGYLKGFTTTNAHNLDALQGQGRVQSVASVAGFPVKQLPLLSARLREESLDLLDRFDAYLVTQREAHLDTKEEVCSAAIGVYLSIDDNES